MIFRVFDVKPDRFLASIEPDEIGAFAFDKRVITARKVTLGAFDLETFA